MFLFVQQKTSSEMRISDWSSDVCSSDLLDIARRFDRGLAAAERRRLYHHRRLLDGYGEPALGDSGGADAHRAVDDDGAGAGVDDHTRRRFGPHDVAIIDQRHEPHPTVAAAPGAQRDYAATEHCLARLPPQPVTAV